MLYSESLFFGREGGVMKRNFSEAFLKDRQSHLINKLVVTKKAVRRELILPAHKNYKVRVLIPQIERALQRMQTSMYGYCLACTEPISKARLLKHPHVERCVPCQEDLERLQQCLC